MSSSNFLRLFFVSVFLLISSVHSQDYTWNLGPLKNTLKPNFVVVSPVFALKAFPFSAQAKLQVKSDNGVYVTLAFKSAGKTNKNLVNVSIVPAVSYIYRDPNNRDVPRNNKCFPIANSGLAYDTFYYEWYLRPLNLLTGNISITISVQKLAAGKACITDAK